MTKNIAFILLVAITLFACNKKNDQQTEVEKIVTEWVGKTIHFPANMTLSVYGKDTLLPRFYSTPYKILFFGDSTGCTSCKLKLFLWQKLIAEADSTLAGKLSFIFCFQPKNRKYIDFMLRRDKFSYPVIIDETNQLNQLNHFPENPQFQCFLLNSNNKVISVGNPVHNPNIWKLYNLIITKKQNLQDKEITSVDVIYNEVKLQDVRTGVKQTVEFKLKNTGRTVLIIYDIKTSCGCTSADWEKHPTATNETTIIKAEITLEQAGYFEKTISVYCNADNSPIVLTVKGNSKSLTESKEAEINSVLIQKLQYNSDRTNSLNKKMKGGLYGKNT